ncbi:MAG: magnesium transporter, partial [Beijerinckiaceae bacterium]|nr:magnesium transporter [Beijerinckiaceae bacterium]
MLRIYTRENECLAPFDLTVTAQSEPVPPAGQILWIDLLNPTAEEDRFVEKIVGVSIPTREEMEEIEVSSRLYNEDGGEFMTMAGLAQLDTASPILTPITFVLKGQILVTVRHAEPRPFLTFSARAQRPGTLNVLSGEQIMLGLLEALIDRIADALERVGAKIDTISREVFHGAHNNRKARDFQSVLVEIAREGDVLSMVRESLVSMTRVLTYHTAVTEDAD